MKRKVRENINNKWFSNELVAVEYNINSEIAENVYNYFVDSIRDIRCSIDDVQYKNQIPVINCRFKFRVISLLELKNICKTIRKKNDYKRISNTTGQLGFSR